MGLKRVRIFFMIWKRFREVLFYIKDGGKIG